MAQEVTPYAGAQGLNFFSSDSLLRAQAKRFLEGQGPSELESLEAFGELCGNRISNLVSAAHQEGKYPRLNQFDRWGARIDSIEYCPEQLEARRLALENRTLPPERLALRMIRAFLLNQNGEGGITCPLAMTDGLIELLETSGSPDQKRRWLPLLSDPACPTPLTAGQFVTERQGGSNVSENESMAEPCADGSWRLTGLKWFCSNPGELWVTTAKPRGSDRVALFLVPRRLTDGSLNECHILRLKDLVGTRGKATAEVEYRGASAELLGRASHGIALLLRSVLRTSRIHTATASLGFMRRATVEAGLYAKSRQARGRPLTALPPVADALQTMEARLAACQLALFREIQAIEEHDPAAEVLIPLLKIGVSTEATRAVRQAQLILAGNGILRDFSILPRLAEDALVQEIWEGTHPILASHALKALLKPASSAAFRALIAEADPELSGIRQDLFTRLEKLRSASEEERLRRAQEVCAMAFRAFGLALLLREANGPLDAATPFSKLRAYW